MATLDDTTSRGDRTFPLGVSRPPLRVADLPEPEEVFGVSKIGFTEKIRYVIGPSLIALGAAIGSGEWLLGPLAIGSGGFVGIAWIITVSALLQVFYNYEIARYVMATGEVPVVGWARVPPGALLWVPVALIAVFLAFGTGGWASGAGQGLFALITGRVAEEGDLTSVQLLGIGLLAVVVLITLAARKISRTLELTNWVIIGGILVFLIVADLILVPADLWWEGARAFVTPALPPEGTDVTLLGAIAGFTALAGGLNWFLMSHYRDKGYGMGHRVGFLSGLRGGGEKVSAVGVTFPDDDRNTALWRRWTGYLRLDLWGIFFPAAMLGMLLPTLLMTRMVQVSGRTPTEENVPTFVAQVLNEQYGGFVFYVVLGIGVLILFSTQLAIFEGLVRLATDAANASPRVQRRIGADPRRFYYGFMILLGIAISVVLLQGVPTRLVAISANLTNFGALIFPFLLMYLNSRLPKAARPRWYSYVLLVVVAVFFGFFFVNFVANEFFGGALVSF